MQNCNLIDFIKKIDTQWLVAINQNHNEILDKFMWLSSDKFFWIPFYIIVLIGFYKLFPQNFISILFSIFILILISDQLSSGIIKPYFSRLRPSHEPILRQTLRFVNNYHGGLYGFVSSHSSNAFSLAFFVLFSMKNRNNLLIIACFIWATTVAYSRIYLGVHYPSDVIIPIIYSPLIAYTIFRLFKISKLIQKNQRLK